MPYIKQAERDVIDAAMPKVGDEIPSSVGELTYAMTKLVIDYLYFADEPLTFQRFSDVAGAMHYTQTELDRRKQFPYEDRKREENGDVYPL